MVINYGVSWNFLAPTIKEVETLNIPLAKIRVTYYFLVVKRFPNEIA